MTLSRAACDPGAPSAADQPRPTEATTRLRAKRRWSSVTPEQGLLALALLIFLAHALNYLYFFVDDEGIPFVFARNLLRGRGLAYNSIEGRVEGYSDFLHVLVAAVWLGLVHLLRLSPLAVFFLGKAVSFASGTATVCLTWRALRRDREIPLPALAAGMGFLVLAAPLAMWSCSSLEMASVTLLVTVVAADLMAPSRARDGMAAGAACLLVLLRIDGIVYVAALIVPAWLFAGRGRRLELLRRVILPVGGVLAAYHAWRVWYFGDWLPAPVAAKLLYKLRRIPNAVVREPSVPYALAFARMYGVLPAIAGLLALAAALRARRCAWPLLATASLLSVYAAVVGDWMPGFRFFLPVLPILAVLIARAVASIRSRQRAWAVTAVTCTWFATSAAGAAAAYEKLEYHQGWWAHPSLDESRYFGSYLPLCRHLRDVVPPGAVTAFNQAGFVPFMLDVDNLDDLGITSRFVARLPTTDVVFTQVGRYSPLTNKAALRAANAYLLYRAPDFVIVPLDNLLPANEGQIPREILRGHYREIRADGRDRAVVYRRTADSLREFRSTPEAFLENVAHPSHVLHAFGRTPIEARDALRRLPFLAGGVLDRTFSGRIGYDVLFSTSDVPVFELHVAGAWARTDVTLTLTLWDIHRAVRRETLLIKAHRPASMFVRLPDGPRASRVSLELEARDAAGTRVILHDVRVQGQTPPLAAYVRQLPFSRPGHR